MEHRSPIEALGYVGWNQYSVFKKHLMLPLPYLKVIVRNYRDLSSVPLLIGKLVMKIDNHIWSSMQNKDILNNLFKAKGVPAHFIPINNPPIGGVKAMTAYEAVMGNITKFSSSPLVLYISSQFETGAIQAASNLIKQAIRENIDARMISFGTLLDETKEWDANSEVLRKVKGARVLCLYMVGKEYHTDFTRTVLVNLLSSRMAEGKVTILSSHMDLAEFIKRYNYEVQAVPMKFEDAKIKSTIDELISYMKEATQ